MAKGTQTPGTKVDLKNLMVSADEAALRGSYASMVNVTIADHDCTLDFVNLDAGSLTSDQPRGFLVARIIVANTNLRSIAELLTNQCEIFEQRTAAKG